MESWLDFIQMHAHHAHWYIFGASLLAGLNVPISIDLLMIISATLASPITPAHPLKLFFAIFLGCLFSAWIAYWIGRTVGTRIIKWPFFSKIFSPKRVNKVKRFYEKKGLFTLILGRFIPFGVRNCLFMSSGISRISFVKFALWDAVACAFWSICCFSLYYMLGCNISTLYQNVKMINLSIFIALNVTVIGIIWYKKKNNTKEKHV